MNDNATTRQLEQIMAGADPADVVNKLRAVLDTLPADEASAKDRHLRATIESFIAGYDLGSQHRERPDSTA
ncbi:hypothetical protein [Pseudarthrobacter albicanus]|uniref:hypothetical protein n=1 Tax=Pseudarthrobacter albicanus TaxID=2823873 RepID=UPI001BA55704|nr:hypothetical protein [Pseudarthrobacter albicanus]